MDTITTNGGQITLDPTKHDVESKVQSDLFTVPADAKGKITGEILIDASVLTDTTRAFKCVVDVSDDGVKFKNLISFTWDGNSKLGKNGLPQTGCSWKFPVKDLLGKKIRHSFYPIIPIYNKTAGVAKSVPIILKVSIK